ncbi:hypothetical protein [Mangrovivirga cuniculi]|uniref:Lipocalin-like domain-containing protein n=1 Tax=Mangrovivirga cuniculi TaxID=2715131 RepID=A0A4D7JPR6_9BACT|nr:hypothetical protein [Mangrovivirga cuniculi]QCK16627.1 hypothetical protein DCC35_18770 [Mangrovivirga cuniculi]
MNLAKLFTLFFAVLFVFASCSEEEVKPDNNTNEEEEQQEEVVETSLIDGKWTISDYTSDITHYNSGTVSRTLTEDFTSGNFTLTFDDATETISHSGYFAVNQTENETDSTVYHMLFPEFEGTFQVDGEDLILEDNTLTIVELSETKLVLHQIRESAFGVLSNKIDETYTFSK